MERPSNKSAAFILALVLALPVVYVLSLGPAVWLINHRNIDERAVNAVYMPVGWLMDHSKLFESAMLWYFRLWAPEAGY